MSFDIFGIDIIPKDKVYTLAIGLIKIWSKEWNRALFAIIKENHSLRLHLFYKEIILY